MACRIAIFTVCAVVACCVADVARAASNVVQYRYAAVGNVLAIDLVNATPITLTAVSPLSGPVEHLLT